MKYVIWIIAYCSLHLGTAQAQESYIRLGVHSAYMPQFTVQEASDNHVRPLGIRLMVSDYDMAPVEFGLNTYARYGDTARVSFGVSLVYLFAERKAHDFKIGLNMSKVELEDVRVNKLQIGPHVGDVRFQGFGNEFKPYVEWEWLGTRYASFFVQMGYRIINGEKTVVTSVKEVDYPDITVTEIVDRDWSFFYSASGFEIGAGLSIHLF